MGDLTEALDRATTVTIERLLAHLPQLLGAIALLLVGWLLARLLRLATRRGAALLDSLIARSTGQSRWRIGRSASRARHRRLLGGAAVLRHRGDADARPADLHRLAGAPARPPADAGRRPADRRRRLPAVGLRRRAGAAPPPPGWRRRSATRWRAWRRARRWWWRCWSAPTRSASRSPGSRSSPPCWWPRCMGGVTLAVSLGARGYVANLIGAHYLRQALQLGPARARGRATRAASSMSPPPRWCSKPSDGRVVLPGRVYHDEAIVRDRARRRA